VERALHATTVVMRSLRHGSPTSGFALLEVVVASAIAATMAAGTCVILAMTIQAGQRARVRTMATIVAARKMEQLRSLGWTHISTTAPAISMSSSDVTTDLSNDPATDDGSGLLRSPAGTLTSNVDGYVDYLDATGRWVGRGASVPARAVYIRRWAVQPHASDPDNLLVFDVVVGTRGSNPALLPDAIHLVSMEARR
jgi:type II secretory pathway pseudopilin PulG